MTWTGARAALTWRLSPGISDWNFPPVKKSSIPGEILLRMTAELGPLETPHPGKVQTKPI
jgi:hypothetical protein